MEKKQSQIEFISIICAAILINAFFVPLLVVGFGGFVVKQFGIGPELYSSLLFFNGVVIVVFDILSVFLFCLNVFYRFRLLKPFDRQFAINLLLMPVPVVFLFTGLGTLLTVGLPALLIAR